MLGYIVTGFFAFCKYFFVTVLRSLFFCKPDIKGSGASKEKDAPEKEDRI